MPCPYHDIKIVQRIRFPSGNWIRHKEVLPITEGDFFCVLTLTV